jgi:hypothetical protein
MNIKEQYPLAKTGKSWHLFPTVCKRKSDDTLWMPSHPGYCDLTMGYYFVKLEKRYIGWTANHDDVWCFKEDALFDVIHFRE